MSIVPMCGLPIGGTMTTDAGSVLRHFASINDDLAIGDADRKFVRPLGPRPDDRRGFLSLFFNYHTVRG